MRQHLVFGVLLLLSMGPVADLGGLAASTVQLMPEGTTTIPFSFVRDTLGVWSGGALLVAQDRLSAAPTFRVFDHDGVEVSRHTFTIPEATHINAYSFARGWDGSLVVGGSAFTNESRSASFVAWVSPDRQEQTVVRTSPFVVSAVTVAADGTIWVAGHRKRTAADEEWDYSEPLIRRYDKTGKLLGSFIPWSSLQPPLGIQPPDMRSLLVSSPDRIGWYSRDSRTYIEFALDGTVLKWVQTPEHDNSSIVWAALCDDGKLFISDSVSAGPSTTRSWGIHALDPGSDTWSFIPRQEPWGRLYGCDGTRLAATTNHSTISWLRPERD
jgi:hypothetical protein